MKPLLKASAILILILLSGCATMIERSAHKSCFTTDWLAAGFDSAKSGKTYPSAWEKSDRKCLKYNVWSNKEEFTKGYALGLEAFCREENGFEFGWRNLAYAPICDEDQQYYFDEAYKDGHILFKARNFVDQIESDIYQAQEYIEFATRRRRELAYQIDSGNLDEHAEKRAVKERYRLKSRRASARQELVALRSNIREAEHRRAALNRDLFDQYYPEGDATESAYSKDQSIVSENTLVTQPALILYRPKTFAKGTGSKYKSHINALTKYITDNYSRTLRYQVVQDVVLTFVSDNLNAEEMEPAIEFTIQPHLLVWLDGNLERWPLSLEASIDYQSIDAAAKRILASKLKTRKDTN